MEVSDINNIYLEIESVHNSGIPRCYIFCHKCQKQTRFKCEMAELKFDKETLSCPKCGEYRVYNHKTNILIKFVDKSIDKSIKKKELMDLVLIFNKFCGNCQTYTTWKKFGKKYDCISCPKYLL